MTKAELPTKVEGSVYKAEARAVKPESIAQPAANPAPPPPSSGQVITDGAIPAPPPPPSSVQVTIGGGAKVKYYAVRRGHKTGIFSSHEEFEAAMKGFSNAEGKVFKQQELAENFMASPTTLSVEIEAAKAPKPKAVVQVAAVKKPKVHKFPKSNKKFSYFSFLPRFGYGRYDESGCCGFSANDTQELLSQGVKPWEEDAGMVMSALRGFGGYY